MTLASPRFASLLLTLFLLALALTTGACPASTQGVAPKSPQLTFVTDESTLEERIGVYLEGLGLKVARVGNAGDVWLVLVWDGGDHPNFRITIDTFVSSNNAEGPQERAVLLRLETGVHVAAGDLRGILERINAHHASNWAGTWYIDRADGQVEASWALNIPREVAAIESGLVHDAVVRLVVSWRELAPQLNAAPPGDAI